jgi:hypothetical protein
MRALPSEVIALIDQLFSWASNKDVAAPRMILSPELYPKLATVAEMVSRIPQELIRLQGTDLAEYVFSVSAMASTLDLYRQQRAMPMRDQGGVHWAELEGINVFGSKNPIILLRKHLANCSDNIPSAGTSELPFFADPELRAALTTELSDVGQVLADREWKAATVLGGATLEAILFWALSGLRTELLGLKDKPAKPLDEWKLYQMIDVARRLDLIEESTKDLAHLARDGRNLVHPAAVKRERRDCDKASSHTVVGAIEAAVRDIGAFCVKHGRKL